MAARLSEVISKEGGRRSFDGVLPDKAVAGEKRALFNAEALEAREGPAGLRRRAVRAARSGSATHLDHS